jgi:hypothetical protein
MTSSEAQNKKKNDGGLLQVGHVHHPHRSMATAEPPLRQPLLVQSRSASSMGAAWQICARLKLLERASVSY